MINLLGFFDGINLTRLSPMNQFLQRLLICAASVTVLASCGGGNDIASGGTGTGVTSASAVASAKATPTVAAMDNIGFASVPAGSILKVAYVDGIWTNTFSKIPAAGFAAPDIVIYSFIQNSKNNNPPFNGLNSITIDPILAASITSGVKQQSSSSKVFISVGGANMFPADINMTNANNIVNNVIAGIATLNKTLQKPIVGVDLDLENGITAETISTLAAGFQKANFLVSIAPQPVSTSAPVAPWNLPNINPAYPNGVPNVSPALNLSSGGTSNDYGAAIASGNVDYIFAQAYNTGPGGISVGGCAETQPCIVGQLATAFNNLMQLSCAGSTSPLCIPSKTTRNNPVQYAIGVPTNQGGAAGTVNSIWGSGIYSDRSILNTLATEITNDIPIFQKKGNNGIMTWVLNADYIPTSYNDSNACVGGFSSVVFGATQAMSCP